MITIIFRFDDYSALSNTKLENQILTTFKENNSTLTIGVIPFVCEGNKEKICKQESIPLLENKLDILKKGINKGYIDVALHGNTHQTIKEFQRSEFLGLNYEQQFTKIESGKLFLEEKLGTNINTFIPPWNRYDLNTLKVLESMSGSPPVIRNTSKFLYNSGHHFQNAVKYGFSFDAILGGIKPALLKLSILLCSP